MLLDDAVAGRRTLAGPVSMRSTETKVLLIPPVSVWTRVLLVAAWQKRSKVESNAMNSFLLHGQYCRIKGFE